MYNTVIIPVDVLEVELSDKAIRHAEFLAQDKRVIHLLYVLPDLANLSLHRSIVDVRCLEGHLQHEVETCLQTMVSHFGIDLPHIGQHVRFDNVCDVIDELGEELNVDVAVIGSRGLLASTYLFGSNASGVA